MELVPVLSGPATAVMLLLLIAGVQKMVDPAPTSGPMRSAGLPSSSLVVRLLGAAEFIVAGSFFAFGGVWPAMAGAALYLGFAGFVTLALVKDLPISSCGCLGSTDTPPSLVHVALNLGSVAVLAFAAIIPIDPVGGLVGQSAGVIVPYVVVVGATVYLLYAMLTVLPLVGRRAISQATPLPIPGRREA